MIKVSVIIPVYNVESYLSECLDSIINQTLKELEIICVDDCSKDNSYNILDSYSKIDNRIILIKHEKNKGLGAARNSGIKIARGEYISFIDSDDYISLNFLENLYSTAIKFNSDITTTLNIYLKNGNTFASLCPQINNKKYNDIIEYEGNSNLSNYYIPPREFTKYSIRPSSWNKVYRKSFLEKYNIYNMEIKGGTEDQDFNLRILLHSPKVSFNNKAIYYYREDVPNSLSKVYMVNIESAKSYFKHLYNVLKYYKVNKYAHLEDIYEILLYLAFNFFYMQRPYYQKLYYSLFHKIIDNIDIDLINIQKYNFDLYEYELIKYNKNYECYMLEKLLNQNHKLELQNINNNNTINSLNNELNYINNKIEKLKLNLNLFSILSIFGIQLFSISNNTNYLRLTVLGIKLTFKVNEESINKISWWIPIRSLRNNFRGKFKIADQTRPDQTRPDQTRPNLNLK